jgi:UPF0755 protein
VSGSRLESTQRPKASPLSRPFRPRRWALLLLFAAGLAVAADLFLPAGLFPSHERHVILVRRGESLREVARELERVGLLHGTFGFQVLARLMHLDRSIKAGQYSLRTGITVPALLYALERGMSGLSLITIPEGLTADEVSVLLSNRLGVPIAEFDSLAHERLFLDSLGVSAPSIEGYLAPDSYEFLPGTSPEVAFRTMAAHQRAVLLKSAAGHDSLPLSLSLHDVLSLASIVESEAEMDDERPRIARVYLNRLQKHMRLQADPTVAYGLGLGPRSRLYLRQLKSETPFNTYMFEGLPPGPICNPGRASIEAVINPSEGVKDLYFVARGAGRHFFAETYRDHLHNITRARALLGRDEGSDDDSLASGLVAPDSSAAPAVSPAAAPAKHGAVKKSGTGAKTPAEKTPAEKPLAATAPGAKPAATKSAKPKPAAAPRSAAPADTAAHHGQP